MTRYGSLKQLWQFQSYEKKNEDPVFSTFYPTKSNKQVLASGAKNLMAIT